MRTPRGDPPTDRATQRVLARVRGTVPMPSRSGSAVPSASGSAVPSASGGAVVDRTAPDTTVVTRATGGDTWTVALTADEPATYECSLDGAAYQPCPATTTYTGLDQGHHAVTARATDAAGNTDSTPSEATTSIHPRPAG